MAYANSADPDQTAPEGAVQEQSDQGLQNLPFHYFKKQLHKKQNLGQKKYDIK